jgi:hypothetical protein
LQYCGSVSSKMTVFESCRCRTTGSVLNKNY